MIQIQLKYTDEVLSDPELKDNLPIPTRKTDLASGYDIVATSEPEIVGEKNANGSWSRIDYIQYKTGIQLSTPLDLVAEDNEIHTFHTLIHPRSSLAKYNLVLANSIGLCDSDYRGEFLVRFKYVIQPEDLDLDIRHGVITYVNTDKIYKKGDDIAQLVFEPSTPVEFNVVDTLSDTKRGSGGFGSTDK